MHLYLPTFSLFLALPLLSIQRFINSSVHEIDPIPGIRRSHMLTYSTVLPL